MKGTVFFRQSKSAANTKRAKKPGTWTYVFSVPKAGGGRRQLSKGGYATKRACEEALAERLVEFGRSPNQVVEPSKMSLAQYLRDEWLPTLDLKPSTVRGYRFIIDTYIVPRIGDVRLCDLTQHQLVKLYAGLRKDGKTRTGGEPEGLSPRSIHLVHVTLSASLGHAVEAEMLKVSPVTQIPKKSRPKSQARQRKEMKVWTAERARAFLEATEDDRLAAMYDLDLNTGLRRGELVGLRWEDVDLDRAMLSVRRNVVLVDYDPIEGTPKSNQARTVDLDDDTVAMLRRHRRRQLEERLAWGEAWMDTGLLFTREDGTALHPQTASWHFRRLVKLAGLPAIRLHDLRHTHATLGLAGGVPAKVMQERLGHSSVQITLDLYSHVIPGMQAGAAAKIGAMLRQAQ